MTAQSLAKRPRILLAGGLSTDAEARLHAAADVVRADGTDESALVDLIRDCDALIARTNVSVTRAVLAAGERLKVVGVAGVGTDRVDTRAAEDLGIRILSTPAASSQAVAEFTLALMLQLLRPIPRLMCDYRAGRFNEARAHPHGDELQSLTVGIVGMGRIGARVGRICAAGFGMRVLYNDIVVVGPFDYAAEPVDKATLWSGADIVTLHLPLTDLTRGLINERVLGQLRPAARLINTCRGAVVDSDALARALRAGRLGGAALDVTEPEPLPPDHALFSCENCILTPHAAARTHGGLRRMFAIADEVLAALGVRAEDARGKPED